MCNAYCLNKHLGSPSPFLSSIFCYLYFDGFYQSLTLVFPISVRTHQAFSGRRKSCSTTDTSVLFCPNHCGRKYKHDASLRKHLKFECGVEKQFRCVNCGKTFSQKAHLLSHLLNIHKIVPVM